MIITIIVSTIIIHPLSYILIIDRLHLSLFKILSKIYFKFIKTQKASGCNIAYTLGTFENPAMANPFLSYTSLSSVFSINSATSAQVISPLVSVLHCPSSTL